MARIRHTGIYVHVDKLHETKEFYEYLGFGVMYNETEDWKGSFGVLEVIKLVGKYGDVIEIVGLTKKIHHSGGHIAIEVDDLTDVYVGLKNDVEFFVEPTLSPTKQARVAFCYDPSGFIVELVEMV